MKASDNNATSSKAASQIREVIEQLHDHRLSEVGEPRFSFPETSQQPASTAPTNRFGFPVEFGS